MKKRFATTLASVLLASVMCVGFAACGDDSAEGDPAKEAENLVGEEVNKATWDAAFDLENYTNFKMETIGNSTMVDSAGGYEIVAEGITTYIYADQTTYGKYKCDISYSGNVPDEVKDFYSKISNMEYYLDEKENKCIEKIDGSWAAVDENSGDHYVSAFEFLDETVGALKYTVGGYDKFEYSAAAKGYVVKTSENDLQGLSYVIKFKDGKLKVFTINSELDETNKRSAMILLTCGGQSVTLPEIV